MLTTLTFNLSNTAIRHELLHGREYIVAPMAMLTEGVHAGSNGPLLYRETECKRAVPAWNMKPVVVYHPEINGQGVSACDPDILERQQVGMVMNTAWRGKLRAEAWIDVSRARTVDPRVLEALEDNRIMEVSTGLFTDNVGEPGEWNGESYTAEATNHQPDHLALLPDRIGACSVADGAGLLQLNEAAAARGVDVAPLFARQLDTLRRLVGNAMSHGNVSAALGRAIREKLGTEDVWIQDVYEDFFVYDNTADSKLFKLGYQKVGDTGIELLGDPEEVVQVTEYRTVAGVYVGNAKGNAARNKEPKMKNEIVNALVANAGTQWTEADRDALMGMDEGVLKKMLPVANEDGTAGKPVNADTDTAGKPDDGTPADDGTASKPAPVTMEQYIANAPAEYRDVLTNGLAAHRAAKDALIKKITANKRNPFTPEYLAGKGLDELRGIAALAEAPVANDTGKPPMFAGAWTPDAPTTNEGAVEEALPVPVMNFGS